MLVLLREGLCWPSGFCSCTYTDTRSVFAQNWWSAYRLDSVLALQAMIPGLVGGRQVPQLLYQCGFIQCMGSGCQAAGPWARSWERRCGRTSGGVRPHQPHAASHAPHPHYPRRSKSSPERTITLHKRLYRLGCRSISRGPLYLFASSSVMKRPSAESQQTPSCWDFFIFSSGF